MKQCIENNELIDDINRIFKPISIEQNGSVLFLKIENPHNFIAGEHYKLNGSNYYIIYIGPCKDLFDEEDGATFDKLVLDC